MLEQLGFWLGFDSSGNAMSAIMVVATMYSSGLSCVCDAASTPQVLIKSCLMKLPQALSNRFAQVDFTKSSSIAHLQLMELLHCQAIVDLIGMCMKQASP